MTDDDLYFMADQTEQSQQLALLAKTIGDTFSDFVAAHWERLCRNAVSGNQLLGTTWGKASRWWETVIINKEKKNIELDVVAESLDKKKILVGECKWTEGEQAGAPSDNFFVSNQFCL